MQIQREKIYSFLSNLKEHLQSDKNEQHKFPERRNKDATTTLFQCSEGAANV